MDVLPRSACRSATEKRSPVFAEVDLHVRIVQVIISGRCLLNIMSRRLVGTEGVPYTDFNLRTKSLLGSVSIE